MSRFDGWHYPGGTASREHEEIHLLREALHLLQQIKLELRKQTARLVILGDDMPIPVGGTTQALWQEFLNGVAEPPAAAPSFSSSDTTIATVDSTGLITGVAPGTYTITGTDSANSLTASATGAVAAVANDSATLTIQNP